MENEKGLERIYEFIENYNFDELSEFEKEIVFRHISEDEYTNMRITITDTKNLFEKLPIESGQSQKNKLGTLFRHPVELYKVAASIVLLVGIGFVLTKAISTQDSGLISMVDTVYVKQIDTLIIEKWDTMEVVKEKVVYREKPEKETKSAYIKITLEETNTTTDCSKNLCPDDIATINKVKANGSISRDTVLSDFIVSIN